MPVWRHVWRSCAAGERACRVLGTADADCAKLLSIDLSQDRTRKHDVISYWRAPPRPPPNLLGRRAGRLHKRGDEAWRGEDGEVVAAGDLAPNHARARRRRWRGLRLEERERA